MHLEPVPSFNKSYSGENYNDEAYQKHNSHKTNFCVCQRYDYHFITCSLTLLILLHILF